MHRATTAYRQTQVTTTTQGEVLLILYDGAINFLVQAKVRIAAKDPAGKGILISKALDIINELDSTLNLEKGGSISENLHNLYFFCNKHLLLANLRMSADMVDEVIKILAGLRSAYAAIQELPEAKAAGLEAAANHHAKATSQSRAAHTSLAMPATAHSSNKGLSLYAQNSSTTLNIAKEIAGLNKPASTLQEQVEATQNPALPTAVEPALTQEQSLHHQADSDNLPSAPPTFSNGHLAKTNLYKKFAHG